jgi:hypothetical protein
VQHQFFGPVLQPRLTPSVLGEYALLTDRSWSSLGGSLASFVTTQSQQLLAVRQATAGENGAREALKPPYVMGA